MMDQRSKKVSPSAYRKITLLVIASAILAFLLQGCGGILYSTLTEAEIRATAYDIATTRLATTIEVPPEAFQTTAPNQPTATLDPTFCPPDAVGAWKERTLADMAILDQEITILLGDVYTPDQLNQIAQRAEGRANELLYDWDPRCATKSNRRLADVYSQFAVTIHTRLSGNLAALPQEKLKLQQAIQKLMAAVREIVHGEDFKPFDDLMSKYQ